jgi:hypothetical protein
MSSFGSRVLTGSVLAVIGLITVKVLLSVVAGVAALFSFLIFTVLPILLIGWLLLKALGYLKKDRPEFE